MNDWRVLLVAGDESIRSAVTSTLTDAGLRIESVGDAESAHALCQQKRPNIAVVHHGDPRMGGLALVRMLRAKHGRAFPIVLLVPENAGWSSMAEAMKAGADETLSVNQCQELMKYIQALLERWATPQLACGLIRLDEITEEAEFDGQPLELGLLQYRTLRFLVLNAGRWVSAQEIADHLYRNEFDRVASVAEDFVQLLIEKMDPDGTRRPIKIDGHHFRIRTGLD